jgi:4a-hydroxytetrahydrobiopterin dehydratase
MAALNEQDIHARLQELTGWSVVDGQISKTYELPTFHRGAGFVTQIAILADVADHHPDIDIRYNRISVRLSTHSENGITEKDFALAARIDEACAQ